MFFFLRIEYVQADREFKHLDYIFLPKTIAISMELHFTDNALLVTLIEVYRWAPLWIAWHTCREWCVLHTFSQISSLPGNYLYENWIHNETPQKCETTTAAPDENAITKYQQWKIICYKRIRNNVMMAWATRGS